jgi:hypothetical protein
MSTKAAGGFSPSNVLAITRKGLPGQAHRRNDTKQKRRRPAASREHLRKPKDNRPFAGFIAVLGSGKCFLLVTPLSEQLLSRLKPIILGGPRLAVLNT